MKPPATLPLALVATAGIANAQISFGPSQEISDAVSTGIKFAKAADMDGDGDLDVVAAEWAGVRVLWWENDGSGHFADRHEWLWGDSTWEVIGFEDANGDNRPDIWLRQSDLDYSGTAPWDYLIGTVSADGSIDPPQPVLSGLSNDYSFIDDVIVDLNGDSRPDLLTGAGLFPMLPDGTLSNTPIAFPLADFGEPLWFDRSQVTAVDWDEDGHKDILIGNILYPEWGLMLLRNDDGSSFEPPVALVAPPLDGSVEFKSFLILPAAGSAPSRALIIENPTDATTPQVLKVYQRNPDGSLSLTSSTTMPSPWGGADKWYFWLNADSEQRVYAQTILSDPGPNDIFTVLHRVQLDPTSTTLAELIRLPGATGDLIPQAGDLDGDEIMDLLLPVPSARGSTHSSPDLICWLKGIGPQDYESEPRMINNGEGALLLRHVGDMDGDGDVDVLVEDSGFLRYPPVGSTRIDLWLNGGSGEQFDLIDVEHGGELVRLLAVRDITEPLSDDPESPPLFTRTWPGGRMDILVQTSENATQGEPRQLTLDWLLQDESGEFHRCTIATFNSYQPFPTHLMTDWDGDETLDLLSVEPVNPYDPWAGSTIWWRRGEGAMFGPPQALFSTPIFWSPAAIDLDWDDDIDILATGGPFPESEQFWLENNGDGTLAAARPLVGGPLGAAADFDGDGHPDFVGGGSIFLARPGLAFDEQPIPWSESGVRPVPAYLDLDQDGDIDFLAPLHTQTITNYRRMEWWENHGNADFSPDSSDGIPVAPARWCDRREGMIGDIDGDGTADLVIASWLEPRLEWFKITRTPEPAAFTDQMAAAGLTGHSSGPLSDWDLDGIPNWDEFAFGSDASIPDPNHPGRPRLETGPSGLSYTFQRRTDAAALGMSYDKFRSEDLVGWSPWTPAETTEPADSGYERVSFPITPGLPAEFFKTVVSDPE